MQRLSILEYVTAPPGPTTLAMILVIAVLAGHSACAADDKALHFGISALCGAGAETFLHQSCKLRTHSRLASATALGAIPGLIKELVDEQSQGNRFSRSDLETDLLGAFSGALISNALNSRIRVAVSLKQNGSLHLQLSYLF